MMTYKNKIKGKAFHLEALDVGENANKKDNKPVSHKPAWRQNSWSTEEHVRKQPARAWIKYLLLTCSVEHMYCRYIILSAVIWIYYYLRR